MNKDLIKQWIKLFLPALAAATIGGFTSGQFIDWMATAFGIATLVPITVEFVKLKWDLSGVIWKIPIPFTKRHLIKAKAARFLTWGFCIVGIVISHQIGWGFQNLTFWNILLNMVIAGFVANGYYKYEWVQVSLAKVTDNIDKLEELLKKLKKDDVKNK